MGNNDKEIERELLPMIRVYKDGSVERLVGAPYVPPSLDDPKVNVLSKDITISKNPFIQARLHLPKHIHDQEKLPILVYYHGGGFCHESAFSIVEHKYMTALVEEAKMVIVSVEYGLAPENSVPSIFNDCFEALQWVALHSLGESEKEYIDIEYKEAWLKNHGDFGKLFLGGDSAGATIAHNVLMRAGAENLHNGVKILGGFLTHPYFWGSTPIGSEPKMGHDLVLPYKVWIFLYPEASDGIDNYMINPFTPNAPSLASLGCQRLLVTVAEKDELRDRGLVYCEKVKESGFKGEVELVDVEGEDHAFHILLYDTENAKTMIKRVAAFICKQE